MPLRFAELSPREFEELCAALLRAAKNHETRHLGAGGSEGGWDVRSTDPDGRLWCTQCKRVQSLPKSMAVKELTKVLDARDDEGNPLEMPDVWTLMASTDITKNVQDALVEAADGRCEIQCYGPTDLEAWITEHPLVRDRFFTADTPRARIAYVSACKADRDVAAAFKRDLQVILRTHWEANWNVKWHDPTESAVPEIPDSVSAAFVLVSPESLADKSLLTFWQSAVSQGHDSGRRRLFALDVASTVPWPDWLVDRFEHHGLSSEPDGYRIDLSKIVSKWIGKTLDFQDGHLQEGDPQSKAEGPGRDAARLDPEIHGRLVSWLESLMERSPFRRLIATAVGLESRKALDDFSSPALQASAAVVLSRQDDDPVRAAERLIRIVREELEDEETPDRLQALDAIGDDLCRIEPDVPEQMDRGLLPAWLKKVRQDHERLVDYFQQRHELDLLDQVYVELEMLPDHFAQRERLMDHASGARGLGKKEHTGKGRALGNEKLSIEQVLKLGPKDHDWVTRRWVVRGDPGAGKTTLLRHLACKVAREPSDGPRWVPVFQSLPVLMRSRENLLDRIERTMAKEIGQGMANVLDREGQDGRLLLLLDGLDEVGPELRDDAESLMRRLSDRWPDTPIVVSTRPIGYRRFSADFRELQLLPLNRNRRKSFLAAWFGRADACPDMDRAETALAQLEAAGLDELAGNPLYLTLMAMLLEQNRSPHKSRSKLYDQVFTLLLEGKHKHDKTEPIERPKLVRNILRRLAYSLTEDNRDTESQGDLQERLYHDSMHELRHQLRQVPRWDGPLSGFLNDLAEKVGILGPHDGEDADWRFWHRTFKEALTAEHLASMGSDELLERARVLGGEESRWAEPFALLTGQVKEPDALVRQLVKTNRQLGLRALATAQGVSDETLDDILQLTGNEEERADVYEQIPTQLDDAERSLKLIDRLRRRTRNGYDLFWLWHAAQLVAQAAEDFADAAQDLLARFFDHIPPPDPELFRTFRTAYGEVKDLWCEVPSGIYWVGSPEDENGRSQSEVRHQVKLVHPYWIGAVPVTNAQYEAFDPGISPESWHGVPKEQIPDFPRVGVSWYEAMSFCRWLASLGDFENTRLPWDAEWEVACRGGTETAYWSGDTEADLDRVGWYNENSERVHRVAEKPANKFGLYDVHGNVWEWIQDINDWDAFKARKPNSVVPVDPATNPEDLATPPRARRVLRGGSYALSAVRARSACRSEDDPWGRWWDHGFRVLVSRPPAPGPR